jgi:hypothetical protein
MTSRRTLADCVATAQPRYHTPGSVSRGASNESVDRPGTVGRVAKWDLPWDEALAQMMIWEHATNLMRSRILDPDAGQYSRQADAQLFAMAVRQVLRFAELCRAVAPRAAWSAIDIARRDFDKESPNAEAVRNVLDHWDAYMRGVGDEFPAKAPAAYKSDLLSVLRPTLLWYGYDGTTYQLQIVPRPGEPPLVLDVARDGAAVLALSIAIQDALADLD